MHSLPRHFFSSLCSSCIFSHCQTAAACMSSKHTSLMNWHFSIVSVLRMYHMNYSTKNLYFMNIRICFLQQSESNHFHQEVFISPSDSSIISENYLFLNLLFSAWKCMQSIANVLNESHYHSRGVFSFRIRWKQRQWSPNQLTFILPYYICSDTTTNRSHALVLNDTDSRRTDVHK